MKMNRPHARLDKHRAANKKPRTRRRRQQCRRRYAVANRFAHTPIMPTPTDNLPPADVVAIGNN